MNTEKHDNVHGNGEAPFHETVTFEPRDINVGTVAKQLAPGKTAGVLRIWIAADHYDLLQFRRVLAQARIHVGIVAPSKPGWDDGGHRPGQLEHHA